MTEIVQKQRTAGANWVNVILGIWIVISPFVLGFSNRTAMMWNDVATGAAIIVLALARSAGRAALPLNVLLGLWLIVSPFILGASRPVAVRNNIVLGIIVAIVALMSTHRAPQPAPRLPNG